MSQAKVDKYKQEKANRKQTMAKEKRNRSITKACVTVVGLALVVWIGISAVDSMKENRPVDTIYIDTAEVDNYINSLYEEEPQGME